MSRSGMVCENGGTPRSGDDWRPTLDEGVHGVLQERVIGVKGAEQGATEFLHCIDQCSEIFSEWLATHFPDPDKRHQNVGGCDLMFWVKLFECLAYCSHSWKWSYNAWGNGEWHTILLVVSEVWFSGKENIANVQRNGVVIRLNGGSSADGSEGAGN